MRAALFRILTILFLASGLPVAAEPVPAAYVMDVQLRGEDAAAGKVIVRQGSELPARLMMPLFDKDVVFLRDPQSRVVLELGVGNSVTVGEATPRYEVAGEIDTKDGAWGIHAAIGGVFAGSDDPAPENMASKGGSLKVPMAVRGSNLLLRGRRSLWLGWSGGKAPYRISLVGEAGETLIAEEIASGEAQFELPSEPSPEKFTLALRDAEDQKVLIRLSYAGDFPAGKPFGDAKTDAGTLAMAAWLTAQDQGAWSIEAAQMLHAAETEAARVLLRKVQEGWRLEPQP